MTLPGVDAVQYHKILHPLSHGNKASAVRLSTADAASDGLSSAMLGIAIGALVVLILLGATSGISNLMGVELASSSDNRGIGIPLSIEEVKRIRQEEQLQRRDLDGGNGVERQWEDLGQEERLEEFALMRVIQGQDVRVR